jgi:hypothetical protein
MQIVPASLHIAVVSVWCHSFSTFLCSALLVTLLLVYSLFIIHPQKYYRIFAVHGPNIWTRSSLIYESVVALQRVSSLHTNTSLLMENLIFIKDNTFYLFFLAICIYFILYNFVCPRNTCVWEKTFGTNTKGNKHTISESLTKDRVTLLLLLFDEYCSYY